MFEYLNSAYESPSSYFGHRKTKSNFVHLNFCNGSTNSRQLKSGEKRGALIDLALLVLERRGGIMPRRWQGVAASLPDAIGVFSATLAIEKTTIYIVWFCTRTFIAHVHGHRNT